jgi:hypothetical protein
MATLLTQYYPFATGAGSNVTEAQWREMARQWLGDGVLDGFTEELLVEASTPAAMTVKVNTGQCRIRGHVGIQEDDVVLVIGANAAGATRLDLVVARADFVNDRVEFDVVAGVAGGGSPALVQTAAVWEIALARVSVANGAVSIVAGNITDLRTMIAGGGSGAAASPSYVQAFMLGGY